MDGDGGASSVAIIGAVTGVAAIIWNIGRQLREGARLHVAYYVYAEGSPENPHPRARIQIANVGTLPAYIASVDRMTELPWVRSWPLVRALSFRARDRRGLRWAKGPKVWFTTAQTDESLLGRLEPGDIRIGKLVAPTDDPDIERLLTDREWLVVETALRQFPTRIFDNRLDPPRTK